jgi:hypothetical protein
VSAGGEYDWEARIQAEQRKISEIFAKLSGGRGISASEAKVAASHLLLLLFRATPPPFSPPPPPARLALIILPAAPPPR